MLTLKILNKFTVSKSAKERAYFRSSRKCSGLFNNIITNIFLKSLKNIKMDTSAEEFTKDVDYIQLGQHSVQWPSFAKEIVSFWYHTCEGLRVFVSYRGGHCTWSLVIRLVG